ncbi:hypothetical protein K8I61_00240 [bacterium]|nr:hypothetical protein [bacterium]
MRDVIVFVAREPGFRVLADLAADPEIRIPIVYTHRRKPTSEDPRRGEREDYARFRDFCAGRGIPMAVKDTFREAAEFPELDGIGPFDYIVSCNWKFRIPPKILSRARIGTINLHRGKLPEYRGLEPVKRALLDARERIHLSAHEMEAEYDTGRVLCDLSIDAARAPGESLDAAVDRLKRELHPLYAKAMRAAMDVLEKEQA